MIFRFAWLQKKPAIGALRLGLLRLGLLRLGLLSLGLLVLALGGCQPAAEKAEDTQSAEPEEDSHPVQVIVVDDAPFSEVLKRQWSARTNSVLDLREMSVAELDEVKQLAADLIIYPADCLGILAHRKLIAPPSESVLKDGKYELLDVFDLQRNAEMQWGDQTYALSIGSPQLVIMYRADILTDLGLEPPETWQDYQRLAEQLTRSELGERAAAAESWSPVAEPLAAGWSGKMLLARAAAYASHPSQFSALFDYSTMEPLIAGPPFVQALEELAAAAKFGPSDTQQVTPEIARRMLLAGETALAITWPSHVTIEGAATEPPAAMKVGFAPLPGSVKAYNFDEQAWSTHEDEKVVHVPLTAIAGKLGSVTRTARRPRQAAALLALLTGREWSELLAPASAHTTLFRHAHLDNPQLWTDRALTTEASEQYAEVVEQTQSLPIHLSSVRIPGSARYLAALDEAVAAVLAGRQSASDALQAAAASWSTITEELGVESQRDAYSRSLGVEP